MGDSSGSATTPPRAATASTPHAATASTPPAPSASLPALAGAATPGLGRPRDPRVAPRVRAATLRLLAQRGYAAVRIDDVVAESGVAKTTIYRRWPSLDALVLDAMDDALGTRTVPETGDPLADLEALVRLVWQSLVHNPIGWQLPAIGLSLAQIPGLGQQYRNRVIEPVRGQAIALLTHARDAGRISATVDPALLVDAIAGVFVFRRLFGEPPPDAATLVALADAVLRVDPG
ncbi:MAG: TetR/AcrR family transcriptional regulator C-terminal ligand-binding domain-containing protein [Dermatophilaceae bacterium]